MQLLKKIKNFFKKRVSFKSHWELVRDFKIESFTNDLKPFVSIDNKFKPFIIKNKMETYDPELFFKKHKDGLSAYDFASLWFCYAKHHKHRFLPIDESSSQWFSRAFMISFRKKSIENELQHMVTILYDYYKKTYIICDYDSIEECSLFLDCISRLRSKYNLNENTLINTYQEF